MSDERSPAYSLQNPFHDEPEHAFTVPGQVGYQPGLYEQTLAEGLALQRRPPPTPPIQHHTPRHTEHW